MSDNNSNNIQSPAVVAKSGLWYTVCTFLLKAMAFLTTPFYARYMSKAELGGFTDFASVASTMLVITSLDLSQSIIRSKSEHIEDMDSYIWSILSLSTNWTLVVYTVFLVFPDFFASILKMDWKYIHILFWYLLAAPPYTMLITKQRAFYQYKRFVLLTGIMTISGIVMAFLLVLLMQDKLSGRIIGYYTPHIVFGLFIFFYIVIRGKKIKMKYWKYASKMCLPLVPHSLSLNILGVSDILLITRLCGREYTAYYSIAYSAYHVASVFLDALNKAWSPWLLDSLHFRNYDQIKKVSNILITVFALIIIGILLIVPEVVLVVGGKQYMRSIYCLPAMITSCALRFIFTMYVNIEFYEKKTVGVSIATMIGTSVNIVLNLLLLPLYPENCHIIAAYTTLIGYMVLLLIHYFIVKRMKMDHVYDIKFILGVLGFVMVFAAAMNVLYGFTIIRWAVIVVYAGIMLYLIYKYKEQLIALFLKKR